MRKILDSMPSKKRIKRSQAPIPDGLMLEILYFLPTKSLRRFWCVSKNWAAMIYRRKTLLPMGGLYFEYGDHKESSPLARMYASIGDEQVEDCFESCRRKLPCFSTLTLLDVCNGLFLFADEINGKGMLNLSVCNPTTMECVVLPELRVKQCSCAFLAYDPLKSPHYTVLRFIPKPEEKDFAWLEIYSSMTGKWVHGLKRIPIPLESWFFRSVYLNGALYILDKGHSHILEFHIERKQFKTVTLRHFLIYRETNKYKPSTCIGISRGKIHYAEVNFKCFDMRIFTLTIEGRIAKWIKVFYMSYFTLFLKLLVHPLKDDHPEQLVKPIGFHPDLEVLYVLLCNKVFSYDYRNNRIDELCMLTDIGFRVSWLNAFTVTPSLQSINPPGSRTSQW